MCCCCRCCYWLWWWLRYDILAAASRSVTSGLRQENSWQLTSHGSIHTTVFSLYLPAHSHMPTFSPKQRLDVNVTAWGTNLACFRLKSVCLSSARYCRLGQSGWSGPSCPLQDFGPTSQISLAIPPLTLWILLSARRRGGLGSVSSYRLAGSHKPLILLCLIGCANLKIAFTRLMRLDWETRTAGEKVRLIFRNGV